MSLQQLILIGLLRLVASTKGNSCADMDRFPHLFYQCKFSGRPMVTTFSGLLQCAEKCKQNVTRLQNRKKDSVVKGQGTTPLLRNRNTVTSTRRAPKVPKRKPVKNINEVLKDCITYNGSVGIYTGTRSVTKSGIECQRWDVKYPNQHWHRPSHFHTGESMADLNNYCRNTYERWPEPLPWCYTTKIFVRWQYCDIKDCEPYSGSDCYTLENMAIIYQGTRNITVSGRVCQRWDSQHPHKVDVIKPEHANYCRVFGPRRIPWCYTTDPATEWEYCDVKRCQTNRGN